MTYVPSQPALKQRTNKSAQPNELPRPALKDTALYRVPIWAFDRIARRFIRKAPSFEEAEEEEEEEEVSTNSSGADDFEVLDDVKTTAQNGNGRAVRRKKNGRGR